MVNEQKRTSCYHDITKFPVYTNPSFSSIGETSPSDCFQLSPAGMQCVCSFNQKCCVSGIFIFLHTNLIRQLLRTANILTTWGTQLLSAIYTLELKPDHLYGITEKLNLNLDSLIVWNGTRQQEITSYDFASDFMTFFKVFLLTRKGERRILTAVLLLLMRNDTRLY